MNGPGDKTRAREEFVAEAQELIEAISRDLLVLDSEVGQGGVSPDTVNDLFRGVHTLKGLAGMFGYGELGKLAHVLEDLLDDLRLGRVVLTQETLDVIFEGADGFQRLLRGEGGHEQVDIEAFSTKVHAVVKAEAPAENVFEAYEFDPNMLSVLTEYEEHRLRANLERGYAIYRLRVQLSIDVIDSALEQIKQRCKPAGEIITYLPSMEGGGDDTIDIEMLIASQRPGDELQHLIDHPGSTLTEVPRRVPTSVPSRPPGTQRPMTIPQTASGETTAPLARESTNLTMRSLTSAVRVDIHKLDYLMNVVGELGTVRSALGRVVERIRSGQIDMRGVEVEAHRIHRAFSRRLSEVQEGVLDIRMVPLAQLFDKIAVIVRGVAREQQKPVRLVVTGGETEVDKLIVEELADPLMHLVRNAVDHGVESEEDRAASHKPTSATIALTAYQKGNHVVIELSDDGRGINPHVIREAVIRKGLLDEHDVADVSARELLNIIFMPGFSTRESVTDLSGRGVGMDVVKTNINRLGGAVEVDSESGVGTKFTITLPITLAIISALLFEVRGRLMSIPLASVQEALRLHRSAIRTVEGREVLTLRGETLPLCRLADLCRFEGGEDAAVQFVVVLSVGNRRLGLVVDRMAGQQDIVIKGLGKSLAGVPFISGATDLGDQRLVLVFDSQSIIEETLAARGAALTVAGGAS